MCVSRWLPHWTRGGGLAVLSMLGCAMSVQDPPDAVAVAEEAVPSDPEPASDTSDSGLKPAARSLRMTTGEIQIHQNAGGSQDHGTVAVAGQGDWTALYESAQTSDRVAMRLFTDGGVARDDERPVSELGVNTSHPVVSWSGEHYVLGWRNADSERLLMRAMDETGTFESAEVEVAGGTRMALEYLDLAVDGQGAVTLIWAASYDGFAELGGRTYDANQQPLGEPFAVTLVHPDSLAGPVSIAMQSDGTRLVVWGERTLSMAGVYLRAYDISGMPLSEPVTVAAGDASGLSRPDIAVGPDDGFVVAWRDQDEDRNGLGVWYRTYGPDLVPLGDEVAIEGAGIANRPAVVAVQEWFVLAWEDDDGDGTGVFARLHRFPDGQPISDVVAVSEHTPDDQQRAALDARWIDGAARGVLIWESFAQDGDSHGIYGRMFAF